VKPINKSAFEYILSAPKVFIGNKEHFVISAEATKLMVDVIEAQSKVIEKLRKGER
jgi:hypothetical protein